MSLFHFENINTECIAQTLIKTLLLSKNRVEELGEEMELPEYIF